MQDLDTSSTQSLIDRYYEEEKAQRERELSLAALTVRLDANDLAMLNIIAKRFRKTRDDIAQEVLSSALVDLFSRLDSSERKLIARDADDAAQSIAADIAEENGITKPEIKTGVWVNHERNFTKIERKKAKLQASKNNSETESETEIETDTELEATTEAAHPEQHDNAQPHSTPSVFSN